ncbi:MAG: hypothetical protein HOV80_21005, partial [Polyangiaceae bacterium]|nr:hypothetical protein [Polyangiaceae bacterium]
MAFTCEATIEASVILYCDGPEDCDSGEACCAGLPGGAYPITAQCAAAAECSELPQPQYFCHRDKDCGFSRKCLPWGDGGY